MMNKTALVVCECPDWAPSVDILNGAFVMSSIHGGGGYTGKLFKFCPWCGKELKEVESKNE